jgi:hypothetical protein
MSKYRFLCQCGEEVERFVPLSREEIDCPKCHGKMKRQLPRNGSQKVREVVDSYTNVRQEEDQKKKTQDRRTEHFWEVEVPRLVQTYSLQTCLEEGWLIYNDKGELVINKPPNKR